MPRIRKFLTIVILLVMMPLGFTQAAEMKDFSSTSSKNADGGFVAGLIERLNGIKNLFCPPEQPATIAVAPKIKKPKAPVEIPDNAFKSEGELRRYLECYATEDGRYDRIAKEYLPLIAVASRSFEIPQTLLACLIFRESRFDINARSGSGAMGLGQHLNGTLQTISNTIKAPEPKSADEKERIAKIKKRLEDIDNGLIKNPTTQDRQDRSYLATRAEMRFQRHNWEAYYDNLRSQKLTKRATPREIKEENLTDPAIAIGATAFYLQSILLVFQKRLDSDLVIRNSDRQSPNYDILLAAAGAYNMGPYEASKIIAKLPEPSDRGMWVDALAKSNEETAGHVLSIRNCIESTASKGDNAWKGPMGSPNYSCKPEEMDQKRVALDKANKLPAEFRSNIKSATMKPADKPKPAAEEKPVVVLKPAAVAKSATAASATKSKAVEKSAAVSKSAEKSRAPSAAPKKDAKK